jgi:hypothetical protein
MRGVEKCLECDRYELEIENLEQGIKLARADAFKVEPGAKDKNFELLLQLTDRITNAGNNHKRHRDAHLRTH